MLLKLNTRGYGKTLAGLVGLARADISRVDEVLLEWMRAQEHEATLWPQDGPVVETCLRVPMYGRQLNVTGTLLVLRGIEQGMRSARPELRESSYLRSYTSSMFSRRHGMCIGRSRVKMLPSGGPITCTCLGPTLVTNKLNSSLSHSPWSSKREALNEQSVLMLNRRLVDHWPNEWNEETIDERSLELAEIVCRVWPGPRAWD